MSNNEDSMEIAQYFDLEECCLFLSLEVVSVTQSDEQQLEALRKVLRNYEHQKNMMSEELHLASIHGGVTGSARESMWMQLFRNIIPKKYSLVQNVLIMDSGGNVSREVDIAVIDEQYTPYVFQYNALKFVPIEAVAVVIECKSQSIDEESFNEWVKRIDGLIPKRSGIARFATGYTVGITNEVQTCTRPIKILAASGTVPQKYMEKADIIIHGADKNSLKVIVPNEGKTLGWWGDQLNNKGSKKDDENLTLLYEDRLKNEKPLVDEYPELNFDEQLRLTNSLNQLRIKGNPLLTLNLQLNQLLMLINNPMLFPHFAYAEIFRELQSELSNSDRKGG